MSDECIRSESAREYLHLKAEKARFNKYFVYGVRYSQAVNAVIQAEHNARERAFNAFCSACHHNRGGECHAFVVGYDTPDDRLYESCENTRHTKMCDAKIDKFLNYYDND